MYSSAVVRLKGVSRRSRRDPFGRCLRQNPQLVVRLGLTGEVSFSCAPRGSRTPNPQIRSLMLYPIELWVRFNCRVKIVDCRSRVLCVLLCFEGIGREPRRKAGSLERSHCLCARRESPAGVPSAEPPTSSSTGLGERSEAKSCVELRSASQNPAPASGTSRSLDSASTRDSRGRNRSGKSQRLLLRPQRRKFVLCARRESNPQPTAP
jgi:hypothetical protein